LCFLKTWGGDIHKDDALCFALTPRTDADVAVVATNVAKGFHLGDCLHYFVEANCHLSRGSRATFCYELGCGVCEVLLPRFGGYVHE